MYKKNTLRTMKYDKSYYRWAKRIPYNMNTIPMFKVKGSQKMQQINNYISNNHMQKKIFLRAFNVFLCSVIITQNKHVFMRVYFPNTLCICWITLNNYFSLFCAACNVRIKFESHMELGNIKQTFFIVCAQQGNQILS